MHMGIGHHQMKSVDRSGCLVMKNGYPIEWRTRRQKEVATSTTGAELIAYHEGSNDAMWLKNVHEELKKPLKMPI